MASLDELHDIAKQKLEKESFDNGTPEEAIRSMCLEWLSWAVVNNGKAVELLADKDKNTAGAYKAMEEYARKKKRQGPCTKLEPLEAMVQVMVYYGVSADDAHQKLEHGLMYHLLAAEAKKFKPYGMDESELEPAKTTPVSDLTEEKAEPEPFSFEDMDSELEGLL